MLRCCIYSTTKDNKTRDKIEKLWGSKANKDKMNFQVMQDVPRPERKHIFDELPEEVLASVMQMLPQEIPLLLSGYGQRWR